MGSAPRTVWIVAGIGAGADPYEVCDALAAAVRAVSARGWRVAVPYDPTLAPLAAYVAAEVGGVPVVIHSVPDDLDAATRARLARGSAQALAGELPAADAAVFIGSPADFDARWDAAERLAPGAVFALSGPGGIAAGRAATATTAAAREVASSHSYPFAMQRLARHLSDRWLGSSGRGVA